MTSKLAKTAAALVSGGGSSGGLIGGILWTPLELISISTLKWATVKAPFGVINNNGFTALGGGGGLIASENSLTIPDYVYGGQRKGVYFTIDTSGFISASLQKIKIGLSDSFSSLPSYPQLGLVLQTSVDPMFFTRSFSFYLGAIDGDNRDLVSIPLGAFTSSTEFCIAFDKGSNGKGGVYIFKDGFPVNSVDVAYTFNEGDIDLLDQFFVKFETIETLEPVTIVENPIHPINTVDQFQVTGAGGIVDVASYPSDRLNKSFECSGMTIPLMSLKGIIDNGDIVIFNSAGELLTPLT